MYCSNAAGSAGPRTEYIPCPPDMAEGRSTWTRRRSSAFFSTAPSAAAALARWRNSRHGRPGRAFRVSGGGGCAGVGGGGRRRGRRQRLFGSWDEGETGGARGRGLSFALLRRGEVGEVASRGDAARPVWPGRERPMAKWRAMVGFFAGAASRWPVRPASMVAVRARGCRAKKNNRWLLGRTCASHKFTPIHLTTPLHSSPEPATAPATCRCLERRTRRLYSCHLPSAVRCPCVDVGPPSPPPHLPPAPSHRPITRPPSYQRPLVLLDMRAS